MKSKRPRILEVLYSYEIGGSQLVGVELAKQLRDDGADVLCAALDSTPGPVLELCGKYGLRVVDLAVPKRQLLGRNGLSWGLTRRLRDLHIDAIHVQHFLGINKLGLPARLAGIKRVVATEHSVFDVGQTLAGRLRVRLNWRLASAITVVHQGIKDYLCNQLNVPSNRVFVIPVGIDVERFHRDDRTDRRRDLGIADEFVFVFVGRLAPVKKVPQLVHAFLGLQSEGVPPSRLLVVGDGDEMSAVRALVEPHPLGGRVILTGEQSDVRKYLAAGDAFVLNSSSEGTPRALLEAMATGLPGVCPAVGNVPEMIAGRGWLTESGSPDSLKHAMKSMLNDQQAVLEAGRRSRTYVREQLDAAAVAAKYRQLLVD